MKNSRLPSSAAGLALCLVAAASSFALDSTEATPQAGDFDSYVLALTWEPAFCQTADGAKDVGCASISPRRFDASNLALHGLWPNKREDARHSYGLCGVGPEVDIAHLDAPATWCQLRPIGLSDRTKESLSKFMPGYASCLQNHEWYRHGSCSGLSADEYFSDADALVQAFDASDLGRYVSAHAGETVAVDDLTAAFEKDFGPGSRKSMGVRCVKGTAVLGEIWISLKRPISSARLDADMLETPESPLDIGCPREIQITKVGQASPTAAAQAAAERGVARIDAALSPSANPNFDGAAALPAAAETLPSGGSSPFATLKPSAAVPTLASNDLPDAPKPAHSVPKPAHSAVEKDLFWSTWWGYHAAFIADFTTTGMVLGRGGYETDHLYTQFGNKNMGGVIGSAITLHVVASVATVALYKEAAKKHGLERYLLDATAIGINGYGIGTHTWGAGHNVGVLDNWNSPTK